MAWVGSSPVAFAALALHILVNIAGIALHQHAHHSGSVAGSHLSWTGLEKCIRSTEAIEDEEQCAICSVLHQPRVLLTSVAFVASFDWVEDAAVIPLVQRPPSAPIVRPSRGPPASSLS